MPDYGKFTARGGDEVEQFLTELLHNMGEAFRDILPDASYRSVVLIGGYGRGEGGVQIAGGRECPHNNLDLMVITTPAFTPDLRDRLDKSVAQFAEDAELGIDISYIEETRLRRSPCLVMWYDMRFGHKTVLGDDQFLRGLDRFTEDRIEPLDVLRLMINRGTLLVINDVFLEKEDVLASHRKLIVKHVMKALIGFGDAYLFSRGQYDWSYLEKQNRMQALADAPEDLKRLYEEALEFRFSPDYDNYADKNLHEWAEELRALLAPLFLQFERDRLQKPTMDWPTYLQSALSREFKNGFTSPRGLAKLAVYGIRTRGTNDVGGLGTRLASRCVGDRVMMPLVYPAVYFNIEDPGFRKAAQAYLQAPGDDRHALRHGFLRKWGEIGDSNFQSVIDANGIQLDGPAN